jgi:hypothetical protein
MSVHVLGSLGPHEPLWRYIKISTLLLLMEGKAFFPSIKSLQQQEPLEALLHCHVAWLRTKLDEIAGNETDHLDRWLLLQAEEWEKTQQERNREDPQYNSHLFSTLYIRELIKRRAAWCWHRSDLESAAMWSIYGNAGVAVATSVEIFRDEYRGEVIKWLKKEMNFFKHANNDPEGVIDFSPKLTEMFIMGVAHGY